MLYPAELRGHKSRRDGRRSRRGSETYVSDRIAAITGSVPGEICDDFQVVRSVGDGMPATAGMNSKSNAASYFTAERQLI
ncbi:MAG: hypothetical protein RLO15_07470 [Parvibaculum sp.]